MVASNITVLKNDEEILSDDLYESRETCRLYQDDMVRKEREVKGYPQFSGDQDSLRI